MDKVVPTVDKERVVEFLPETFSINSGKGSKSNMQDRVMLELGGASSKEHHFITPSFEVESLEPHSHIATEKLVLGGGNSVEENEFDAQNVLSAQALEDVR
ncbi:hypothetical protein V6N13_096157 [Hibiscus sabdariffa]|uniref:Uncharacterized protein n=1 Tax=Hibiscus sabdariffa TaxID=183260 RepID=A0ABR2DGK9_9ROSI